MRQICFATALCALGAVTACRTTSRETSETQNHEEFFGGKDNDPAPGFFTVESLATLSDDELFAIIREKGVNAPCLPTGKSVGKPGRITDETIRRSNPTKEIFAKLFKVLGVDTSRKVADIVWKGKVFDGWPNPRTPNCPIIGSGANRIGISELITLTNRTFTRTSYLKEKRFIDASEQGFSDALNANTANVNLVELNYSDPKNDPFHAGKNFGIRDIMVPIEQPDGSVIYIGRAYVGEWKTRISFESTGLIAWFFLDFSQRALDDEGLL